MKKLFLLCAVLFAAALSGVDIAEKSLPRAVIVTGEKPVKAVQLAAFELQHILKMITGARLPIVEKAPSKGSRIFLGSSYPGKLPKFKLEEYMVRYEGKDLILAGNDSPLYGKVNYSNVNTYPPRWYNFRSTLWAVYDFLEKDCGVMFCSYGDLGVAFTPTPTLKLFKKERFGKPGTEALRFLSFSFAARHGGIKMTPKDERLLQMRWRNNALYGKITDVGLGIYWRYYKKAASRKRGELFIESRPEYFARGFTQKYLWRYWEYPNDPDLPPQLCYAAPGVWDYYAWEAQNIGAGKKVPGSLSNIDVLPGVPFYYPLIVGDNTNFCRCPKCLTARKNKTISQWHFAWIAEQAQRVAKASPGSGIATLAYSDYFNYPDGVELPENISVQLTLAVQSWFHPYVYAKQHGEYKKWMAKEAKRRPMTLWLYLLTPTCEARGIFGYDKYFPVFYHHKMGQYVKGFLKDGVKGIFAQTDAKCNLLEGLILARLLWDPSQDPEKLINDYFTSYYGHAAPYMKQLYDEIEKITGDINNYHPTISDKKKWHGGYVTGIHQERFNWYLGTAERVARLNKLVEKAEKAARTDVEKQRIQRFRRTLWNQTLQGRKEFEAKLAKQNVPIPSLRLKTGGKPVRTPNWWVIDGDKCDHEAYAELSLDKENIKLRYVEKNNDYAWKYRERLCWHNGLELFFLGNDGSYEQIAIDVRGKVSSYKKRIENGVSSLVKEDYGVKAVSELKKDQWVITVTIPRKSLSAEVKPGSTIKANFFRTKRHVKTGNPEGSLGWSPIFTDAYAASFYRAGSLIIEK